jgi:hypothetical protein
VNSNVGWVFDASIHVTHHKLLASICGRKQLLWTEYVTQKSKETVKKLDKEFKSTKNSYFANHFHAIRNQFMYNPAHFVVWNFGHCTLKSSEIFMNPSNFLPLDCCWKLATIFPPLETPGLVFPHLSSVHKSEPRKCAFSGIN